MNLDRPWRGCVFIGTSLDGYIAKPDGDLSWLTEPEQRGHIADEGAHPGLVWETFYPTVDALVIGRTTYDTVSSFDVWPFEGKIVVVLSTTLTESEHAQIARSVDEASDILAAVHATRVYVDGGRTIQSFLAAGLIDEITVSIAPILLGRGRPLRRTRSRRPAHPSRASLHRRGRPRTRHLRRGTPVGRTRSDIPLTALAPQAHNSSHDE